MAGMSCRAADAALKSLLVEHDIRGQMICLSSLASVSNLRFEMTIFPYSHNFPDVSFFRDLPSHDFLAL